MANKEKCLFEKKESYKHRCAIDILAGWMKYDYLRIVREEQFSMNGFIKFIVDLACYTEDGLVECYEVVCKNDVNVFKQWKMYLYFKLHEWDIKVWRVDADWILRQTKPPKKITKTRIL